MLTLSFHRFTFLSGDSDASAEFNANIDGCKRFVVCIR